MTVQIEVEDLLDTPTTLWQVLSKLNVHALSEARMMNGLKDRGQHVDSNHHADGFRVYLESIASVLSGVFPVPNFEAFLAAEKRVEHVYLDAADDPECYAQTIKLARDAVAAWRKEA